MVAFAPDSGPEPAVSREETAMRKERLAQFRKKLEEKHRQLVEGVGKTVSYAKGPEDDSTKDLGDQAATSYNREFLFELSNGDRRLLKEVGSALQKLEEGTSATASGAGRLSRRSAWKPFPLPATASSANGPSKKKSAPPRARLIRCARASRRRPRHRLRRPHCVPRLPEHDPCPRRPLRRPRVGGASGCSRGGGLPHRRRPHPRLRAGARPRPLPPPLSAGPREAARRLRGARGGITLGAQARARERWAPIPHSP